MSKEEEIQLWTERFRVLGAKDPEGWAKSQVNEGIRQYARFIFLREAWSQIIADGDTSWIESQIVGAEKYPGGPGGGIGPALKRILAQGVSREDLAGVVRTKQWELLSGLAYQLADPGMVEYPDDALPQVNWELFEVDPNGKPLHPISCLHESVLQTDPTGREMCPKPASNS
jgi:hypothetical protein